MIDLFVHDSLHTRDNLLFELRAAWPKLRLGGLLMADDADDNDGASVFADEVGRAPTLIREPEKDDVLAVWVR